MEESKNLFIFNFSFFMKKFIKKTLILVLVLLLLVITAIVAFKYKVSNIKIDELTHILIIGDSHTQSGIDDSKIKNALNISQSTEHFLYSYNVLNQILNNNSQIDKVILGISFHSFGEFYDRYIHDEDETMVMFPRYFPILDIESIRDINKVPLKQGKNIIKNIIKSLFNNATIHNYPFVGSFYKSYGSNLNDSILNTTLQRHYFTNVGNEQGYSEYQVKYLNKIVELCSTKNIELIIINTPIYYKFYNRIPEKFVVNYYSMMQQFKNKIHFYDFHSVEFPQDCYGDADHLNARGAIKLSLLISERMDIENKK
jgi:hypothetical protein